jgi:hypothetical protein
MRRSKILGELARYALITALTFLIAPLALAQGVAAGEFDQTLAQKTVTFDALNPYTNTLGAVTITVTGGDFHVKRIASGRRAGWTFVTGKQEGSFKFVPYDSAQPTYEGTFKFGLSGDIPFDRHSDILPLNFNINATGSDGSIVAFIQEEFATVNEFGADVSFGQLSRPNPMATE